MKTVAAVVVAFGVNVGIVGAWPPVAWSGTWTSRGVDVEIVRMVSGSGTARGWKGFVEALLATRSYRIRIAHTAHRIAISFPGDASNMLTLPETPIDSGPSVRVVNRGEWWTKHITSAHSDSAELEVASATFSGWWRNGSPDEAKPKPTDFRRRFVLVRGPQHDQLTLRVHVADEKGELEYIQTFSRER